MSGIFGIVDTRQQIDIRTVLAQMSDKMSHRAWYVSESHLDDEHHLALGRIGIGIFNKVRQPVWNPSHTAALVMAGEFYNRNATSHDGRSESDEEWALALYERLGENWVTQLKGAFVIAVWDKTRNRLVVANDHFGSYPLFYTSFANRFIFAPEMKGILCDKAFPRKLDLTALAQYMRFQHLLGERTFFEDIQLLPPASLLTYDLSACSYSIRPYWTFSDIEYRPEVHFEEAVEEVGRLLHIAVQRASGDAYRPGVYLSGGLDSRTILGMVEHRPVVSATYGAADSRDVYYAGQIAKIVGSEHHWFDLSDGQWVKEYADFHLELTEGFHSWIHAHGISTLPQARALFDVNLTGWDGGTVMGHPDSIEPLQSKATDNHALVTRLFYLFNQENTWPSITEAEEGLLYSEPIRKQVQGLAFDSFRAELSRYLDLRPDVRGEYFYIRNHCGRLTQNLVTFFRSHIEVRFPFFDYGLFDFLYSLPATLREDRGLYRAMIQRETPRLALVPYDRDGLLPTTQPIIRGAHAFAVKIKRRFNRHLWQAFRERATLYADYENYLRHELRDWAEGILFDRRIIQRGIFNPDSVHSLIDRHLSGREQWTIGKIAPLITYEMMLRRFLD
jgi:asparagine synthase (glutamine-hydrolysing)